MALRAEGLQHHGDAEAEGGGESHHESEKHAVSLDVRVRGALRRGSGCPAPPLRTGGARPPPATDPAGRRVRAVFKAAATACPGRGRAPAAPARPDSPTAATS
ncbi:hypothetical protein GCM10009760_29390 [Kitasatospora kazusensis]|uniref:Uncharacterized protein n=1 Tax=Kitasatospora kazusensis TaxID=407974 RepID=A0ABP5LBI8_9ACTN